MEKKLLKFSDALWVVIVETLQQVGKLFTFWTPASWQPRATRIAAGVVVVLYVVIYAAFFYAYITQ